MEGRQGLLEVSLDELSVTDTLCAANPDLHPGLYVRITVRDTGCGIPPQILPRIFDPFFTTKDVGKGTGLGLAVVLGIVKNHDGAILVTSQPGQGAEFQILLPALLNGVVEIQPPVPPPRPANGEHILMVDDEPAILQGIKRLLVRAGYEVTVHDHPLAALRDFTTRPEAFHLVLSDLTMPGLNGLEFAARIFDLRPGLPVILATGFAGDRITPEQRAEHPNLRRVVEKPLHPEAILQLIAAVLRETPNPQPAAGKILPG
jgi:CheY-like chemotaxis protein